MRSTLTTVHDCEVIIDHLETELKALKCLHTTSPLEVSENALQVVENMISFENHKLEMLRRVKQLHSVF